MKSETKITALFEARLQVKGFLCLEKVSLCFRPMTVLIGEQASGKSVTAKLYYFFTQILTTEIRRAILGKCRFDGFEENLEQMFSEVFPVSTWLDDTFQIEWTMETFHIAIRHSARRQHLTIRCSGLEETFNAISSDVFIKQDDNQVATNTGEMLDDDNFARQFPGYVYSRVESLIDERIGTPTVTYIPAGRSFFSTIQENVFSLLSRDICLDYFLTTFGTVLERVRRRYRYFGGRVESELLNLVLHGHYEDTGTDQWIVRDDSHKVRLSDASSGQQEALPLLLVLSNVSKSTRSEVAIIEEPEAHLYPTAQRAIIDSVGMISARASGTKGFILTTHSPFILCCLNNLLMKKVLSFGDVSAYHLHDGKADDIMNAEVNLIDAERFDELSTEIANGE